MLRRESRPLSGRAIARLLAEHGRHARGGPAGNPGVDVTIDFDIVRPLPLPVDLLAYDPETGRFAGAVGAMDHDGKPRLDPTHYVVVADDFMPTEEALSAVRVDADGVVHPSVLRKPPPPPPVKPGPSDDPGEPLSEAVIARIRANFRDVVAAGALAPVVVHWRPTLELGFLPADGRCMGATLDPRVDEHRHEMVCVPDDVMPTVEDLRRVRVHKNGWVTWEPEREPEPT